MGPIGVQEMVVIFLVALVLFGPKKLPELGKNLAKAMGEFRRAQSELKATFDREMQNLERETASLREEASKTSAEIAHYSNLDSSNGAYSNTHLLESGPATAEAFSNALSESTTLSQNNPTVGASEVSSAELHAEQLKASYSTLHDGAGEASLEVSQGYVPELTSSEGTVARGTVIEHAKEADHPFVEHFPEPENNPLPEFGHPKTAALQPGSNPESNTELPSLA